MKLATPKRRYQVAVDALVLAAIRLEDEVTQHGPDVIGARGRLRLAAHDCAVAARVAGVVP